MAVAAMSRVTVPVLELPPVTAEGDRLTLASAGKRWTVTVVDCVLFWCVARILAVAELGAGREVVTLKVALVVPAGIVTMAGTRAIRASLLLRATTTGLPAAPLSVTLPVAVSSPAIVLGVTVTEATVTPLVAIAAIVRTPRPSYVYVTPSALCNELRGEYREAAVPTAVSLPALS